MDVKKMMHAAIAGVAALGMSAAATQALAAKKDNNMEKCYGVAKAGKNDCGTSLHACSGQSKMDGNPQEWIYLPKGTCEKIVNGSLKPKE